MHRYSLNLICCFLVLTFGCKNDSKKRNQTTQKNEPVVRIKKNNYGTTQEGQAVAQYTLRNENGMEVSIINYGGRITGIAVPDVEGNFKNVVLGFEKLSDYEAENPYFGALVGRYGNRIANAEFRLGDETYTLAANNGPNNLHGGVKGFDKVIWTVTQSIEGEEGLLELYYQSPHMEEGFPGTLDVYVTYTLNQDNELTVRYKARTDKTTIVNLTQHAYFNLSGDFNETILDHVLQLDAQALVAVDENLIPTGALMPVEDTPFDFNDPKPIGRDITADHEQIALGGGYDHCWVLDADTKGHRKIASVVHPASGRSMEVSTTEPGVQLYTGNFLDGSLAIPGGGTYNKHSGFCLETQHYPDSPNQASFPSVVLEPGENYETVTTFRFYTN